MAVGKNKRLTKGGKKGGKKKMYVIKLLENDNQMFDGMKFRCLLCRCCILILIWSDRSWVMLVYMCAQFVFSPSTYCRPIIVPGNVVLCSTNTDIFKYIFVPRTIKDWTS